MIDVRTVQSGQPFTVTLEERPSTGSTWILEPPVSFGVTETLEALDTGCISLSWGRKSAMAERIEGEWSVTIASEGSQRGHPTCTRT